MFTIRKASERGQSQLGWLDSRHTFSFSNYHDPAHMGFGVLRVINDDRVKAGEGFGTHSHRDMEIITYVLDGALEHQDSMGNGSIIHPGDVQHMSAGRGVSHSEFNASKQEPVRFLQIWVIPERSGGAPRYGQEHYPPETRRGQLRLVASADGRDGSLEIAQDASMFTTLLSNGDTVQHTAVPGRRTWIHAATGMIEVGEHRLEEGDALGTDEPGVLVLRGSDTDGDGAQALVFDLPGETP
ncbi:MAG: pirin family protein [Nannocystaceae bacterium]|nr:pirin family protein [Nannocystaceae bacterium]